MPLRRPAPSRSATAGAAPRRTLAAAAALGLAALSALAISQARAADGGAVDLTFFAGTAVPPWTAEQIAAPDRLTFHDDPYGTFGGKKIARFSVALGDSAGGGNRAEVYYKPGGVGAERHGETNHYAFSVAFPDTVTADGGLVEWTPPTTWGVVTQAHPDTVGHFPVVALETRSNTQLQLIVRGGDPKMLVAKPFPLPIYAQDNGWHDFLLRWTRSSDATGVVQLWHRRGASGFACRVSYLGPNMYKDKKGTTVPAYLKQGIYRDGAKDGTHPTVVQHTGIRKAVTREDAAGLWRETSKPAEFIPECPTPTP